MISTISSHKLSNPPYQVSKLKDICTDSVQCCTSIADLDLIDNPSHSKSNIIENDIFRQMKYERNRLYSFQDRWPLHDITPENLAVAGLFYLQEEDKVQCPFCQVILLNWTREDNPLREHMRSNPKCPFLMGCDVGNVPISREKYQTMTQKPNTACDLEKNYLAHTNFLFKPKHPRMADVKKRLLTYSGWPLSWLTPQQLAECGLYYSGIADVVTCFSCGGSLGNWEITDDPWSEHTTFFPNCAFLSLAKDSNSHSTTVLAGCEEKCKQVDNEIPSFDITSDLIREAKDIFPEDVVLESVRRKGGNILSLQELCDDILEVKQEKEETSILTPEDAKPQASGSPSTSQALLCVICMDKERGIAFQPCGHFVSCPSCANKINDCPMCRKPIMYKMRIYHT